jgi:signal peptidase I
MRIAVMTALLPLLAGCAGQIGSDVNVIGDQSGGKIPNGVSHAQAASNAARVHCAKFNKKTYITQWVVPTEGDIIVFECK